MARWQDWIGRSQQAEDHLTPGLLARFGTVIDCLKTKVKASQGIQCCLSPPNAATSELDAGSHPRRGGA